VARADYLLRGICIGGPFLGHAGKDAFAGDAFLGDAFAGDAFLGDAALADAALAVAALALTRSLDALFWSRLASRVSCGVWYFLGGIACRSLGDLGQGRLEGEGVVTWVTEVGSQLHQSDYGAQAESRGRGGGGDLGHGGGQLMVSKRP
jgi:hypothetical protein